MSPRLLAFLILLLCICIPGGVYYYFVYASVSSIQIAYTPSDVPVSIRVSGTFSRIWLPLADRAMVYEQVCTGVCNIQNIPPLVYNISVSSSGYISQTDTVSLSRGQKAIRTYTGVQDIRISSIDTPTSIYGSISAEEKIQLLKTARIAYTGSIDMRYIGTVDGLVYLMNTTPVGTEIVQKSGDIYTLAYTIPASEKVYIDGSRNYIVAVHTDTQDYIDIRSGLLYTYPYTYPIVAVHTPTSIYTGSGHYVLGGDTWYVDPLFSDAIDISPQYRVGYIAGTDTQRRALLDIDTAGDTLVLLDRYTGKKYIRKTGMSIEYMLSVDGPSVLYVDRSGGYVRVDGVVDSGM